MPRTPWLLAGAACALVQVISFVWIGQYELAGMTGLAWLVFLQLFVQREPQTAPNWQQRLAALALLAVAVFCLRGVLGVLDHGSEPLWSRPPIDEQTFYELRTSPLLAGAALLVWTVPIPILRKSWSSILALVCPLFSPANSWVRAHLELSEVTTWLSGLLIRVAGGQVVVQGDILGRPGSPYWLKVESTCSPVGAMSLVLALLLLGTLVTGAPWRRALALVPVSLAVALVVNVFRITFLFHLAMEQEMDRFNYWHGHQGGSLYSAVVAVMFFAIALPVLTRERRPSPT